MTVEEEQGPEGKEPSLDDLNPESPEEVVDTLEAAPDPEAEGPAELPDEIAFDPEEPVYENTIYAVKTSIGHERIVADAIENKAIRKGAELFAILGGCKEV